MMRNSRLLLVTLGALSLAACFGGKKVPPTLLTLTSSAPAPASINRAAAPGEAEGVAVGWAAGWAVGSGAVPNCRRSALPSPWS